MRYMSPIFLQLFQSLALALPQLPASELFWRLHLSLGALSHTMCMAGRFQILPPGVTPPADAESLTHLVLTFITAGMEAPCA